MIVATVPAEWKIILVTALYQELFRIYSPDNVAKGYILLSPARCRAYLYDETGPSQHVADFEGDVRMQAAVDAIVQA